MSDQLVLRKARFRVSGHFSDDDYDVVNGGAVVGRLFKPGAGVPEETPWEWTILDPAVQSQVGFTVTREEAKAAFARSWRRLGLARSSDSGHCGHPPPSAD